ncbi:DHS-like NAD/FAD-binding domain-containing protein [Crassisporium funariophilum]|nr:DHS-like NAD/FAD-binding domain-containing protein [Crassisporium funariophilum]
MAPSKDMAAFQELLRSSKNIIAVAGAGLSAASGIPTFRGAGGMWRKYDAMSLATPEGFHETPSLSWQFYHYRRETARKAQPNNAHRALAAFSLSSVRHAIVAESTFTLITQNVDGLSARANQEILSQFPTEGNEEPHMIEMHGRLFDVLCSSKECQHMEFNPASPICEALSGTENLVESGVIDPEIDASVLPKCSKCGAPARPGVVWFGEIPHHLDDIDALVEAADLCLVIGTSSTVQPAASYAFEVQNKGGKVAVFNLERSAGDRNADFRFLGPCEETLPKALGLVISDDGTISVQPSPMERLSPGSGETR